MTAFADTNIFVHLLLDYDAVKSERCRDLFTAVEAGEETLETSHMVIAEVVWFLARPPLRLTSVEVRDRILPLVEMRGMRITGKALLREALEVFTSPRVSFIDAFNVAYMRNRGLARILSYDKDFDRIPGIVRVEP